MNPEILNVCAWCFPGDSIFERHPELRGRPLSHDICQPHKHGMLVEQVMAMHGRGSSDPKRYRKLLESMSCDALKRAIEESDFPALSLTENAGVIASADTGTVPGSARETLTPEPALP